MEEYEKALYLPPLGVKSDSSPVGIIGGLMLKKPSSYTNHIYRNWRILGGSVSDQRKFVCQCKFCKRTEEKFRSNVVRGLVKPCPCTIEQEWEMCIEDPIATRKREIQRLQAEIEHLESMQ